MATEVKLVKSDRIVIIPVPDKWPFKVYFQVDYHFRLTTNKLIWFLHLPWGSKSILKDDIGSESLCIVPTLRWGYGNLTPEP